MMGEYSVGEYIIYRNGDKYELGRIKSLREDGAFVAYHEGETGALTPYSHMHKLINRYCIKATLLGGDYFKAEQIEQKRGEWIPCSERLPEVHEEPYYVDHEAILHESDYVLTCCKYGKGFVYAIGSVIHDEVCDSYEWSGLYDYAECVIDDMQVLAWMPLPQPYKAEREGE